MSTNEIPYLKGIGIRIHTVRYQKVRKRALALDVDLDGENDDENDVTAKERRRIHGEHYRAKLSSFFLRSIGVLRSL